MTVLSNVINLVSSAYPGLVDRVRAVIETSEAEAAGAKAAEGGDSFLWEHTLEVTAAAFKLAVLENIDPFLPVVTALFHDAGKFGGGRYHAGDSPEEADAGRMAQEILSREGVPEEQIVGVVDGLLALYNENMESNPVTAIVHDADFLVKSGRLGAARFFQKATLRGRTLQRAVLASLSKELTYAACLPDNMRTAAGRRWAKRKRKDSLHFYLGLLEELREAGIADYRVEAFKVEAPRGAEKKIEIMLVLPSSCRQCGSGFGVEFSREGGIKCEKLTAAIRCQDCRKGYDISFCLPEIVNRTS